MAGRGAEIRSKVDSRHFRIWLGVPRKMDPGVCKSIAHNLKVIKIMDRIDEDRHIWSNEAAKTV